MQTVFIRREATKEVRTYKEEFPWESDYIWSEGNYACDCNRHLFFERAAGIEPPDNEPRCGDDAYAIRIEDETGKELYRDDRW